MYKALLLCNSVFPNDPAALPRLHGPTRDGLLLWAALVDPSTGCFRQENVDILFEGSRQDMADAAERFFAAARPDDVLLFFYSGHGRRPSSELLLCCRDTVTSRPIATGLMSDSLNKMIERSSARSVIVILDCCYSGAFKGEASIEDDLAGEGRFVIAATSAYEEARDADKEGSASPFTAELVAGLTGAARDMNKRVTLEDLYAYLDSAISAPHPKPRKNFDGTGSVAIAYRPVSPVPEIPVAGIEAAARANQSTDIQAAAETFSEYSSSVQSNPVVDICVAWGQPPEILPTPFLIKVENIICIDSRDIPDYPTDDELHRNYYRKVVEYYRDVRRFQPIRFAVKANDHRALDLYVDIQAELPNDDFDLRFAPSAPLPPSAPPRPRAKRDSYGSIAAGSIVHGDIIQVGSNIQVMSQAIPYEEINLSRDGSHLEAGLEIPKLLPRRVKYFDKEFYLAASKASVVTFDTRVYLGNARPYSQRIELKIEVVDKKITYGEILRASNIDMT